MVLMRPERAHERLVILVHGRVAAVWDPATFQPPRDAAAALAAKRDDAVRGNSYRPRTARAASLRTQEGDAAVLTPTPTLTLTLTQAKTGEDKRTRTACSG